MIIIRCISNAHIFPYVTELSYKGLNNITADIILIVNTSLKMSQWSKLYFPSEKARQSEYTLFNPS